MVFDPTKMSMEQLQTIANRNYPGIAMYARDVNLQPEFADKYTQGQIIREKAFTDASCRFMGMVTTHRYVILSNHMTNLGPFEKGTNWGLHIANAGSHFKVMGKHTFNGKTGIFLLHLPDDESWKVWRNAEFSIDSELYKMAVQRFTAKCCAEIVPELATTQWLDRCSFPLGMNDNGEFWPLEDAPEAETTAVPREDAREIMRERYRGCLLGGAVGDALGYPVEFIREDAIWDEYGDQGIQTLDQAGAPARISDDTQMTLFAANAIVYANQNKKPIEKCLWLAYREWLGTQGESLHVKDPENPAMWIYRDRRLHARRAPGITCLNAIRTRHDGGTMHKSINGSKGCGTVMRAAPFGLAVSAAASYGDGSAAVHKMAACDAALTHGHELAWASSSILAQMIYYIVQQHPEREYRLEEVIPHVNFPGDQIAHELLERAVELARNPAVSDLDGIHQLGEGWIAEEALAIAVFCAVRYQDNFAAAIRAAVNHKGDSDSTGAICGNILGAWLGKEAVEAAFDLNCLELRDLIEKMADQLFEEVEK